VTLQHSDTRARRVAVFDRLVSRRELALRQAVVAEAQPVSFSSVRSLPGSGAERYYNRFSVPLPSSVPSDPWDSDQVCHITCPRGNGRERISEIAARVPARPGRRDRNASSCPANDALTGSGLASHAGCEREARLRGRNNLRVMIWYRDGYCPTSGGAATRAYRVRRCQESRASRRIPSPRLLRISTRARVLEPGALIAAR